MRMEPVSAAEQSCHSFHLKVSPQAEIYRYQDGFGNRVHHFGLLARTTTSTSWLPVSSRPIRGPRDLAAVHATWPMAADTIDLEVLDFLKLRRSRAGNAAVGATPGRAPPGAGTGWQSWWREPPRYIHENFEYAKDVTLAGSPMDDLLEHGKGVCQDFTHLMIAVLRSFGVPARYASGYVHRANKESQSHAWCEAWLPQWGWVGVDPTNDCVVDGHFVKVATGRDFTDVPPNRGVYRGRGRESIFVRVETRELERLPSLSWQEQLPPLEVPLTAIVSPPRPEAQQNEEAQQQQQ